jgi:hypothetical protein
MSEVVSKPSSTGTLVLAACVALIPLLVIVVKLLSGVFNFYDLYLTTGGESFPVYSIWKLQNGHPLYEWPNRDFYQLTLYNFGFYYAYAYLLSIAGFSDQSILLGGRLLTLVFALMGCLAQFLLMSKVLGPCLTRCKLFLAVMSLCVWLNSYCPGLYYISVRPDIPAASFAVLGMFFFVGYLRSRLQRKQIVLAGLCFIASWCFKQNAVATLLGCCVFLLLSLRLKPLAGLCCMMVAAAGAVSVTLGEVYRWNTLVAPTVNEISLMAAARTLFPAVLMSLFFWICIILFPLLIYRSVGPPRSWSVLWQAAFRTSSLTPYTALMCVVLAGGSISLVALGKTGSSLNHVFEVLVAASSLSCVLTVKMSTFEVRWRTYQKIAAFFVVLLSIFPFAQVTMNRMGPITRVTEAEVAGKREFAMHLRSLPKPLFIADEIYSLPWHSNAGRYPAITIDPVYYYAAKEKSVFEGNGLADLINNKFFGCLILFSGDNLIQTAKSAGYREALSPANSARLSDAFGKQRTGVLLMIDSSYVPKGE